MELGSNSSLDFGDDSRRTIETKEEFDEEAKKDKAVRMAKLEKLIANRLVNNFCGRSR
jgi:hypothetical protein